MEGGQGVDQPHPGTATCPAWDRIVGAPWAASVEGRAGAVVVSCFRRLQVHWDRDSGRFFAFVLVACALVCFNRL